MLGLVKNHTVSSLIGRSLFAFRHLILGAAVEISGLLSCFQLSVNMSQALSSHWGNSFSTLLAVCSTYERSDKGVYVYDRFRKSAYQVTVAPDILAGRDDLFQMLLYDLIMF